MITNKLYKFIKLQPLKFVVDVLASTAVFVGTTVHQMSPWTTMCCHRYEEVGRTLHSDTWQTVVPAKAASVAETSTSDLIKVVM